MPPFSPVIPSTTDRHSVRPATQAAPSIANTGYERAHTGIIPPPLIASGNEYSTPTIAADSIAKRAPSIYLKEGSSPGTYQSYKPREGS